ncbi:MAG: type I restriction enzyme HsdR N-terminal domain-containing protein [Planctomycetaceae bacterium]
MDLIDRLQEIGNKIPRLIGSLETEEATKNALIMPFINALGYNVFDPTEVIPEFTADVGIKKGEKVDYAINKDSKLIILIECKKANCDLDQVHASQLYRYFSVTHARFGILTNGVQYRIFSDLDKPNVMDQQPFFEFDMTQINDRIASEIKKFTKDIYDLDEILSTANDLKYRKGIKRILTEEWTNPSEQFVKVLTKRVYDGMITQTVLEQFTALTKKAFQEFVAERVNERLKTALDTQPRDPMDDPEPEVVVKEASDIETTEDEIEGFYIVKSILREIVDVKRVFMRDTASYCGILFDDNNRKPICRLHFNRNQKYLGILDEAKVESRIPISDLTEIYQYADKIQNRVALYLNEKDSSDDSVDKAAAS